ncbi:MAG: hypothetical protein Q4F72_04630 [Desulfovibrionaceae bacterium]|nr:hypothetical protein [Desulfovibrionaceae bacterium]
MITIEKNACPPWLAEIGKHNPRKTYDRLTVSQRERLRGALLEEQGWVCAFCGEPLGWLDSSRGWTGEDMDCRERELLCFFLPDDVAWLRGRHPAVIRQEEFRPGLPHNVRNAHLKAQSVNPELSLDYGNLVASCDASHAWGRHCDVMQGARTAPVSPLEKNCLSLFSFDRSGRILPNPGKGAADRKRASDTIDMLGLNAGDLRIKRCMMLKFCGWILRDSPARLKLMLERDSLGRHMPFHFVARSFFRPAGA